MRFLEAEIKKHQRLYYVENQPVLTDRQFDKLLSELQQLESAYPQLASPDSPARMVGSDLDSDFPKFEHTIPVLSLSNTYSTEEAVSWAGRLAKDAGFEADKKKPQFLIQWKVDGATLVLYYEKGRLVRAVTRGSGQIGDVVTANALTIRSIPHQLSENISLIARGEAYMTFSDFERFNEESGSIYANPRNLTSGSLKHKKSKETARRPLRWVAFDVHFPGNPGEFTNDSQRMKRAKRLGLPVFEDEILTGPAGIKSSIEKAKAREKELNFPVDGLVIKTDDLELRKELGFTAAAPRWATAVKFEPDLAVTTIEEIEVFTGRTGRVTPRARLKPVKLAGTTVTYATLHNADFIENLGVRQGAVVKVSKRGDIIPAVEEVVEPGPGKPYIFPSKCPVCGTKLVREEDMVDRMCPNPQCDEKKINTLIFFCARKQMDIAGLGEKTIRQFYEKGLVRDIEDLYTLPGKSEEIEQLEGFGKKSVKIIENGLEESKKKTLSKTLPALGLKEIGPNVTDILIQNGYRSIDKILELTDSKDALSVLDDMDGIGELTAKQIVRSLNSSETRKRIRKLQKHGLCFEEKAEENNLSQIFEGQTWCVTGSFAEFKPRDLAMAEIRKRGGKTTGSVSGSTTHLLAGEKAGSKLSKAQKQGIEIIDEMQFLKLLNDS